MDFTNKLARFMRDSGPARVLIPIGIILIVFGIIMLTMHSGKYEKTEGTITSVTESAVEEDQKQYDVGFTYTVNGTEYQDSFPNLAGEYKVGDKIDVYYDVENPEGVTNSSLNGILPPILIAAGVAAIGYGAFRTARAFKKSKELDKAAGGQGGGARISFDGFKTESGVTEYYFRFDGHSLKPGYLMEDANRKVLFEGKMLKNSLIGARVFEFTDHTTGKTEEHEIGHTKTETFNNEFFSVKSWFSIDGKNVWDEIHRRGLRMNTALFSKFPNLVYEVTMAGEAFALIETSSMYVHEEDEAEHSLVVPTGRMYYRFWTASDDFDLLFLTIFAISESEQTMVE